jgi:hypothetical protein
MYLITGINDAGNFYDYAILEEHESYDSVLAAVGEQIDNTIAFYFEHDEPLIFSNENIVEILFGYQYQIK